eukprot:12402009-Karenia_brevis.AAC.1
MDIFQTLQHMPGVAGCMQQISSLVITQSQWGRHGTRGYKSEEQKAQTAGLELDLSCVCGHPMD